MTTTAQINETVLRDVYDAFNAGDVGRLTALFAPDMVMTIPGSTQISGTYRGHDEIFAAFARMAEITQGTSRAEIRRLLTDDHGGVVIAVDHAVRDGEPVTAEYADAFRIDDGRVTGLRFYPADSAATTHFWR